MTLIVYIRFRDGCILISDRQASDESGRSREKQKSFLSRTADFALAGAGDGIQIDFIFSQIGNDTSANGENVKEKLDTLIQDYFSPYSGTCSNVFGILIAWENGTLVPYEIKIERESELRAMLGNNPSVIEEGLTVLKQEYPTESGPIDLLCSDNEGRLCVVELKLDQDDNMLLQALRYYDWAYSNRDRIGEIFREKKT